jgi:[ribosomal protein S18]-alanine N-acetyltransferase
MNIRPAIEADLAQLVAISDAAEGAAHWSRQQWLDIFHSQIPARVAWTAWSAEQAVGFLVVQCGGAEWELENIAVLPSFRRRGVGAALLSTLLAEARRQHAERILLEVRASNQSAIRLYRQAGFQLLGRRRGYYQNPAEDALILGLPTEC